MNSHQRRVARRRDDRIYASMPFVCPGCLAVAPERCAPGCIDAAIEEDMRNEQTYGNAYEPPPEDWERDCGGCGAPEQWCECEATGVEDE